MTQRIVRTRVGRQPGDPALLVAAWCHGSDYEPGRCFNGQPTPTLLVRKHVAETGHVVNVKAVTLYRYERVPDGA